MLKQEKYLQKAIDQLQYMSHWKSMQSLQVRCAYKKSYLKLRKFEQKNFGRKYQIAINHIFLQRFYLVAYAMQNKLKLQISDHYYIENGLIFGIYQFFMEENVKKHVYGIKMQIQVQFQTCLSFFEIIQSSLDKYSEYVLAFNSNNPGQYQNFSNIMIQLFSDQDKDVQPQTFIQQFQQLPLAQHYIFNIKLKNALLVPNIRNDHSLLQKYKEFLNIQRKYVTLLSEQTINYQQVLSNLQAKIIQIYGELQKKGKIAQLKVNNPKANQKNKQKQSKQLKITTQFRVILSPSRSLVKINQKQILQKSQQQNSISYKKIQIRPQNGTISPVSGNVIDVKFIWQLLPQQKNCKLKIQCYNNRKLQQIYFEQVYDFWKRLQNNEEFRQMIGIDKYKISLKQNYQMQVAFINYIPGCLLNNLIKQIDKLVALAISMDQVIQICQKKGLENEDPNNYVIQPYMIQHTKQKFKRALYKIEKNSDFLYNF